MTTLPTFIPGEILKSADLDAIVAAISQGTAPPGTNTTQLATCAFVTAAVNVALAAQVSSIAGLAGQVTLAQLITAGLAPTNNPIFSGVLRNTGASIGNTIIFDSFTGAYSGLANYTAAATDECIIVNKSPSAPQTAQGPTKVTIPGPGNIGRNLIVGDGKGDADTNNISIVPVNGLINGGSPLIIANQYGFVWLKDASSQWNVIGRF